MLVVRTYFVDVPKTYVVWSHDKSGVLDVNDCRNTGCKDSVTEMLRVPSVWLIRFLPFYGTNTLNAQALAVTITRAPETRTR